MNNPFLSLGFKRYIWIFIIGLITGSTQLPLPANILGLIGLSLFLKTQDNSSFGLKEKFLSSWIFGIGYFCISLYWICFALFIEISYFWWLIPFAFFGMPVLLACFFGVTSLLWDWQIATGLRKVIYFSLAWMAAELARSFLFTGFPWALLGYAWTPYNTLIQLSSYTGVYGLSLLALLVGILPYFYEKLLFKHFISLLLTTLGLLGVISLGGHYRLRGSSSLPTQHKIRLVQPNIAQTLKWDPREQRHNLETLIELSILPTEAPLAAIIWPESALTYELTDTLRLYLKQAVPPEGVLISGFLRYEEVPNGQVWNSLLALDHQGILKATYDKAHLVPFGEYIPFRAVIDNIFLGKLKKVTHGLKDFSQGPGLQTLHTSPLPPFSPLICYEIIFPGHVANHEVGLQPQWILNLTNDGWYGNSAGPYQHLEMARLRAVEEGLPVVRVANTGISAVFNAYGQEQARLGYGKKGVIDVYLPASTPYRTFFSKFKDIELYGFLFILMTSFFYQRLRSKRNF